MGGRMTEYFDYLNCPPADLAERKQLYCSLKITDEMKKLRREHLAAQRKEGCNDSSEEGKGEQPWMKF